MPTARFKTPRGLKAALDTLASGNGLVPYQIYHLTDTGQIAIATANNAYQLYAKASDIVRGLSGMCSGKPGSNEMVVGGIAPYTCILNTATSTAKSLTAASASTVFTIKKNGTSIGTVTFASGGQTGTVALSSGTTVTLTGGSDTFTVHAPGTQDTTLADILFLFRE